ncbi:MAG: YtxH domain-containing protein [Bacteroidales bacterium]
MRGRMFLGILAGLAAGTIIGILFAPDKGSATREKIVHKGEDYVDNLKTKINGILSNSGKRNSKVKEGVS